MCTVTFIARKRGYLLGMNRDEKRSRPAGLPPSETKLHGHRVIHPSEPGGGTWISLNDSGVTLALINWYSVARQVTTNLVSRGEVIPSVSTADSSEFVEIGLAKLTLPRINPFRLIGVFQKSRRVVEWRWDLRELTRRDHPWTSQQWISSGFDETTAQTIRSRTFKRFLTQTSAGTSDWLQRLHASHTPKCGPFSTCMHRSDAVTVSYTQVSVSASKASLHHIGGAPCEAPGPGHDLELQLQPLRPGLLRNRASGGLQSPASRVSIVTATTPSTAAPPSTPDCCATGVPGARLGQPNPEPPRADARGCGQMPQAPLRPPGCSSGR